jgi:hypothetical protein
MRVSVLAKAYSAEHIIDEERKKNSELAEELSARCEESKRLHEQLHQARQEHISTLQEKVLVEARMKAVTPDAAAGLEGELREAKEHNELLTLQVEQLRGKLAENAGVPAKVFTEAKMNLGPLDAAELEGDLRGAREYNELLTLQVRQLQSELARIAEELTHTDRARKTPIHRTRSDATEIAEISVTGERDTPPYREISFVARGVRVGSRTHSDVEIRLVEHRGRPGIAIFGRGDGGQLFEAWRESGREDGCPYMLLVDEEEFAREVLDAMGALDWQLLRHFISAIRDVLNGPDSDASLSWRRLARRLQSWQEESPPRLRHRGVQVIPLAKDEPSTACWAIVLSGACYRDRTWERLTLHWTPGGQSPKIAVAYDADNGPPLLSWPLDDCGTPANALVLPTKNFASEPEVWRAWEYVSSPDKAFLSNLLNVFPLLAVHVQASMASDAGKLSAVGDLQAATRNTILLARAKLQLPAHGRASSWPRAGVLSRVARRLRAILTTGR